MKPTVNAQVESKQANSRKTRLAGVVVSDKMTGTATVAVTRTMRHPLYKKTIKRTKKYKAANRISAKAGNTVLIEETKPIAKDVRYMIVQILQKKEVATPEIQEESDLELLLGHDTKEEEPKEEGVKG